MNPIVQTRVFALWFSPYLWRSFVDWYIGCDAIHLQLWIFEIDLLLPDIKAKWRNLSSKQRGA